MVNSLRYTFYIIISIGIGLLSWLFVRKWKALEDAYDDVLDAKVEAKTAILRNRLYTKRKAYIDATKEYNKILNSNSNIIVFVTPISPSTNRDADPESEPEDTGDTGEVPRGPEKLH